MLKIAEYNTKTGKKIDLKELEQFGFEKYPRVYVKNNIRINCNLEENKKIYIDEQTRIISIGIGLFNTDVELETIFDLIEARYVEKVEG